MKILSNKKFRVLVDKIEFETKEKYNKKYSELESYNYELLEDKQKYYDLYQKNLKVNEDHKKENVNLNNEINKLEEKIKELKIKNREANSAKGGFTKKINRLTAELKEAKDKLSKRYILTTVPKDKTRSKQKMAIYSKSKTSNIIRKVKDEK